MDPTQTDGSVIADQTAQNEGIDESRFHGSVSYTPDEPAPVKDKAELEKGDAAKGDGERPRKVTKIPDSMKPAKAKDPTDINARFHDLSRSHEDLRRELQQARQELHALRTPKAETEKTEAPKTYSGKPRPKSDDFESYDAYTDALTDWKLEERTAQQQMEQRQTDVRTRQAEREATFWKNAGPVIAEVPNLMEVLKTPGLAMSEPMYHALMDPSLGEMGPYTALYLATHQQEAIEIYRQDPFTATIAVARLAQRLESELRAELAKEQGQTNGQPAASVQQRPKLVPDLRGGPPASGDLDAEPSDEDDINTWRRKEGNRMAKQFPGVKFFR